jgi:hypothetical protein
MFAPFFPANAVLRPELPPLRTPLGEDSASHDIRQSVTDIMVENWIPPNASTTFGFRISLPISKEHIVPVFKQIQDLGRRLLDKDVSHDSDMDNSFITHMKQFAMLYWYEV